MSNHSDSSRTGQEIAVIGMSGRFPGAGSIGEFWDNLVEGRETISFFSDRDFQEAGVDPGIYTNPDYVRARGYIENIDYFDAAFFGYSPREVEVMDVQLRVFYECVWEVFEDGGYDPAAFKGLIGVYAGATPNFYWNFLTMFSRATQDLGGIGAGTLRDKDSLSMRISYKFDLKGPSYTLYTACSTSLAAVDQACRGLLTGECDMAAAGGVTVSLPHKSGYLYQEGMIYSPDGHCRTFDAGAGGTNFCDGAGVVLLKRLEEAIEDRDFIYAVIKGSGINNDGIEKVGYTAPSSRGQAEVIRTTLHLAEVDPGTISYIEAHGTATAIGDPIELEGLMMAFNTDKRQYCRIGSVKTNVGHLDCAAGIAGLIKTALMLKHRLIPPTLHFETPNPKVDFPLGPFIVNTGLRPWTNVPGSPFPLRAGVSAFGIGGTNAHVVLEEAPPPEPSTGTGQTDRRVHHLLILSARTPTALEQITGNMLNHLQENLTGPHDFANLAYTLQVGRRAFPHRRMLVCRDRQEAVEILGTPSRKMQSAFANEGKRSMVFMFPGQGSQYVNMGLGLYRGEPVFHEEMDRCFNILTPLMGYDLKEVLYPSTVPPQAKDINQTEVTQPMIFAIEYALAKLLMAWGIRPDAMIGHSIGEYTAACLSGVFTLEEALELVALRGRLMQQLPGGSMLSVTLPEAELEPLLSEDISLAAVNSPSLCVVSGSRAAIKAFAGRMAEKGVETRSLHTSHAFHSAMMDPILEPFAEKVGQLALKPPQIPYASNVSGNWITREEAVSARYWSRHLRSAVRFSANLEKALATGSDTQPVFLVEVGPGRTLTTLANRHTPGKEEYRFVNLLRHPKEDAADDRYLLDKIGRLWLHGAKVDWPAFHAGEPKNRIPLPTYPFERQRFWIEGDPFKLAARQLTGRLPVKRPDISQWFYIPSWKRSALPEPLEPGPRAEIVSLVFLDTCGLGEELVSQLRQEGGPVVTVKAGAGFGQENDLDFTINPADPGQYGRLWSELRDRDREPGRVFHLWSVTGGENEEECRIQSIDEFLEKGYYSLLHIARAVGVVETESPVLLLAVSDGMADIAGETHLSPLKAVLLGPVRTIRREYPNILCRSVDIRLPGSGPEAAVELVRRLILETGTGTRVTDVVAAYRGRHRWVETFEPFPLADVKTAEPGPRFRPGGVYLITGGLGGIGLTLARDLAKRVKAKLILIGRSPLPERQTWQGYLESHDPAEGTARKIREVLEIESDGAEVLVVSADAADETQMRNALAAARERFGGLNGVIHSAGVPDAALIQVRTPGMSEKVFAAKIRGTLVLWETIKEEPLDFFVLCSSISSVLAPAGEVAYCAANAFIDAFARRLEARGAPFTTAINWDAWQEVGMMMDALKKQSEPQSREITHPLFQQYNPMQGIYTVHLRVRDHWFLEEHRIMDNCMLSGTTYLEMVRAAFEHHTGQHTCEIREMQFLNPLVVGRQETREVQVILEPRAGAYCFSCVGRTAAGKDRWTIHAAGEIAPLEAGEPEIYSLETLKARCNVETIDFAEADYKPYSEGIQTGPRWNCLRQVKLGKDEGLITLELPGVFSADLEDYPLHPALLDKATGTLGKYMMETGGFLPFSYRGMRIHAPLPLPRRLYSYVRYLREKNPAQPLETMVFEVILLDEAGTRLVTIDAFTLLTLGPEGKARVEEAQGRYPLPAVIGESRKSGVDPGLYREEVFKYAMTPEEGIDVFHRVLQDRQPQVLTATRDLSLVLHPRGTDKSLEESLASTRSSDAGAGTGTDTVLSRSIRSSDYAPPRSEVEEALAQTMEEFLGIDKVGIRDDFFELGIDSLKAVNLAAKLKKRLHVEVSFSEIFNRPSIEELALFIEGGRTETTSPDIGPIEDRSCYPLTSQQKRLFALHQAGAVGTAYNIPFQVELPPDTTMEVTYLESLFNRLIQRHESLRTSFHLEDEEPVQRIHDRVEFKIECYDLTAFSIHHFLRPFDLAKAPLLRVGLVNPGGQRQVVLADIHHIIVDGRSLVVLVDDFMTLLKGAHLPPLTVRYRDYTQWMHRRLAAGILEKQEAYWKEHFKGTIPVLNLPTDFPRPGVQDYEGDRVGFEAGETGTNALKTLAQKEEATLFMVLLAIYNIFLSRVTRQEDIIVGTPTAGRNHPDLQSVIGMFVNTLALRNFPVGETPFNRFLADVKKRTAQAFDNQELPFEHLLNIIDLKRDRGRNPLFDVQFQLHSQFEDFAYGGKEFELEHTPARMDLGLVAREEAGKISFTLVYAVKLFKKETIEVFRDYFMEILKAVIADPQVRLKDIALSHGLAIPETDVSTIDFGF